MDIQNKADNGCSLARLNSYEMYYHRLVLHARLKRYLNWESAYARLAYEQHSLVSSQPQGLPHMAFLRTVFSGCLNDDRAFNSFSGSHSFIDFGRADGMTYFHRTYLGCS